MTEAEKQRGRFVSVLLAHQPETNHREAYCGCGAPIGDWGAGFPEHLADKLLESEHD